MITRNNLPPVLYLSTPSPETSPRASTIFSDCEADDEDTMSEELEPPLQAKLTPAALQPVGPYSPRIPTLQEILSNTALPPFTLSAFTAYLHQNHCLENLEFIKDAKRYQAKYNSLARDASGMQKVPSGKASEELKMLWRRLLQAYIIPNAPREVNLAADVRDALIELPNSAFPPPPAALDIAVERIVELMNDSILMNFINEHSPARKSPSIMEDIEEEEERRSRKSYDESRIKSPTGRKHSPSDSVSILKHLPSNSRHSHHGGKGRLTMHTSNSSTGSGDMVLTDDSSSLASISTSPMTPPTTPPSSDMGNTSPKYRQDNTWRKMMGRLGTKKRSSSRMDRMEE